MSAAFQVSDVEELLALMEQWGVAELHLAIEDSSLDLVRATRRIGEEQAAGAATVAAVPTSAEAGEAIACELVTIFAPVVGIFHLATRGFPQRAPHPGDHVQAGQNLGSIELMQIPSDLVSPISGIIEAILVEDGAGVEYGQPLMVIRPFEEVNEDEAGMLPPPPR